MNQLIHETSPYLLQHAHNPVEWYAWGNEAFAKARAENKPILVSIGYSTCHWCHVMERESFEHEPTAAYMNEHFVCIKVDREERPDIDHIYMEAVQVLSGSGGWPLNCFLLPDGRPFFGGTYYPPQPMHNRPSWVQMLANIRKAFQEQPDVVEKQAKQLLGYIGKTDANMLTNLNDLSNEGTFFSTELFSTVFKNIKERFDDIEGGFGGAPKFPGTMNLEFLLAYHHFTDEKEALAQVELSLDKMCCGGIYDQLFGGFARYATDRAWLVPHFEKMLYDNALLISVLSKTYKVTKKRLYADTIVETLDFIKKEMTAPDGGFYSALDADSEGVEGKFYVWQKNEIDEILQEDSALFCSFYDVSEYGNWEEQNILWRAIDFDVFAQKNNIQEEFLREKIKNAKEKLFAVRSTRIRPGLDDKILLDWSSLMCSAYAHAYTALQTTDYQTIAIEQLDFLLEKFAQKDNPRFFRTYKNGVAKYEANVEDYAFLVAALLDVYEISFDKKYLKKAKELTELVIEDFYDEESALFYFAAASQKDLVVRRKELYDNATPAGNSTMAHNLQRLSIIFDENHWSEIAEKLLMTISKSVKRYPTSFARYALAMLMAGKGFQEISVVGTDAFDKALAIQSNYFPNAIFVASKEEDETFPLLEGKAEGYIYLCQNYACQRPVESVEEFYSLLNK